MALAGCWTLSQIRSCSFEGSEAKIEATRAYSITPESRIELGG